MATMTALVWIHLSKLKSLRTELIDERAFDLYECIDAVYEKDDIHSVKYIGGKSDGWMTIVGKQQKDQGAKMPD